MLNNVSWKSSRGAIFREGSKVVLVLLCVAVCYGGYGPTITSWLLAGLAWLCVAVHWTALVFGYMVLAVLAGIGCWFAWLIFSTFNVEWTPFFRSRHKGENYQNVTRGSPYLPSHLAEESTFQPPSETFEPASDTFTPATQWRPDRARRHTARPSLFGCGPTQKVCPSSGRVTHTYADGSVIVFDKDGHLIEM